LSTPPIWAGHTTGYVEFHITGSEGPGGEIRPSNGIPSGHRVVRVRAGGRVKEAATVEAVGYDRAVQLRCRRVERCSRETMRRWQWRGRRWIPCRGDADAPESGSCVGSGDPLVVVQSAADGPEDPIASAEFGRRRLFAVVGGHLWDRLGRTRDKPCSGGAESRHMLRATYGDLCCAENYVASAP